MKWKLRKCLECGAYTLRETCKCGSKTKVAHPAPFSPEDPYGKYRRKMKKEMGVV